MMQRRGYADDGRRESSTERPPKKRRGVKAPLPRDVLPEFTAERLQQAARSSLERVVSLKDEVDSILRGGRLMQLTDNGSSWVFYVPEWYKRIYEALGQPCDVDYSTWFTQVWDIHPPHHDSIKMFGKDVLMPRYQQVYGQSYRFSGKLFEAEPFPALLTHAVKCMQDLVVHPESGETYLKAGLVNWYNNGDHYMGPHSDDESNIYAQSPVFSLSLGASRRFVFTPRTSKSRVQDPSAKKLELTLHDGDLLIMGGTTQTTHKHALPKMKSCGDKRISITLRCFK